jgi:hypothetical protein
VTTVKKLGLGNSLDPKSEVLHTSIYGQTTLGRISDLTLAWVVNQKLNPSLTIAPLRMLVQALLEFACSFQGSQSGTFEFAIEGRKIYTAVRFPFSFANLKEDGDGAGAEKFFSQFWMNDENAIFLRKILFSNDHVEVRFHQQLNLVEWRVCRSLDPVENEDSSFLVFQADEGSLKTNGEKYTDLGDLPYQEWLADVYSSKSSSENRTGDLVVHEKSKKSDLSAETVINSFREETDEGTRIADGGQAESSHSERVTGRKIRPDEEVAYFDETGKTDKTYSRVVRGSGVPSDANLTGELSKSFSAHEENSSSEIRFLAGDHDTEELQEFVLKGDQAHLNAEAEEKSDDYLRALDAQFLEEKMEFQHKAREAVRNAKMNEIRTSLENEVLRSRASKAEKLLSKKEAQKQKIETENRKLSSDLKILEQSSQQGMKQFREKALEMFAMLKKAKALNRELEARAIPHDREFGSESVSKAQSSEMEHDFDEGSRFENREAKSAEDAPVNQMSANMQIEELTKKLERTNRALETEKNKVKGLSERVMVAEKESQSAAPLVKDLEKKVENTLKMSQQHKKETEQVKQKLVASEAEKNAIKNELVKTQAQMTTLAKRHAA